jgi:large subunit ribosomal protein L2
MKLIYLFKRIINKLAFGATSKGGRNFLGRVCVNARGRGNKKICHQIDFLRRVNCFGKVLKICAERGRTGFLGIILYDNGLSSYFLLSEKIGVFDRIYSGIIKNSILIKTIGWAVPLKNISLFSVINSVELFPSNGAKLVRSAGNSAIFIGKFHDKAILKLNSG